MDKVGYHVQELRPGIWVIDEFSMDYIYVIEGRDQAVLLDTGTGTWDLRSEVERLVRKPYDVVITHAHMDHAGGIGQFETVHVHREDLPCFELPEEVNPVSVYKRHQYCDRALAAYGRDLLPFNPERLMPVDMSRITLVPYEDHTVFDLGGRTLESIQVPGHTRGSCCFLDKEDRILFTGDNFGKTLILPGPGTDRERISGWLAAAEELERRSGEFDLICSGHFCPLERSWFLDMLEGARRILDGTLHTGIWEADELLGPMYHYGSVYFTMDPENIRTRDFFRIRDVRHY